MSYSGAPKLQAPGPFRADQLRPRDSYELSKGHPIQCLPTGGRGGRANLVGGSVLDTDPAVQGAAVDAGFSPEPGTLRAPDVSVGNVPDAPGWIRGTPPLAVEYADTGQDEEKLQEKIVDLLEAGTHFVWVVRLVGPRRVEVYEQGASVRVVTPGNRLAAPGILKNSVPVEALYDRDAAHEATLRNLLQRKGFESLEDVTTQGRLLEARAAVSRVLHRRKLPPSPEEQARIDACADLDTLARWIEEASVAGSAADALR